jgi:hypothetical protein
MYRRPDKGGTERAEDYTFFYRASAVRRVEFVSARMSYTILKGRW